MATGWLDAAAARERAAATRAESAALRAHIDWTLANARKEIRRTRLLLSAAEQSLGFGLVWQEPDSDLDRILVPLDGGLNPA